MNWARILAFVTGMVDKELLARSEYLVAENRILKAELKGRLKLSDAERAALAEIGHRLGRKVLAEVANVARPDTILAWYRKLIARKFDGAPAGLGSSERLSNPVTVLLSHANDRIAGALANLGYKVCDQTSAMSCNAMLCLPPRSASARQPGRLSFGSIWRCWPGPTSSPRRC